MNCIKWKVYGRPVDPVLRLLMLDLVPIACDLTLFISGKSRFEWSQGSKGETEEGFILLGVIVS